MPTATPTPLPTSTPTNTATPSPSPTPSIADVTDKAKASVVFITTETGSGSGIVLPGGSRILTNAHIIPETGPLQVTTNDGVTYPARIVGSHEPSDLAVLEIAAALPANIPFGSGDRVRIGDEVIVLSYPSGLTFAPMNVSRGVVSGIYSTTVQTDAIVNPGSSGGPLLDRFGNLLGIVSDRLRGTTGFNVAIRGEVIQATLPALNSGAFVRGRVVATPTPALLLGPTPTPQSPRLSSWSHPSGDASQSNANGDERTLQPPLSLKWSARVGECQIRNPLVDNGVVYAFSSSLQRPGECYNYVRELKAYDALTGKLLWQYPLSCYGWVGSIALRGKVYLYCSEYDTIKATSGPNMVYALNTVSPSLMWTYNTEGLLARFLMSDGNFLFLGLRSEVVALDMESGTPHWRYRLKRGEPVAAAAEAGTLYLINDAGFIEALEARTGKVQWQVERTAISQMRLVLDEHRLLLMDGLKIAAVLDKTTGKTLFELPIDVNSPVSGPIFRGIAYGAAPSRVNRWENAIVALEIDRPGARLWEAPFPAQQGLAPDISSFAYANGFFWMGSQLGGILAFTGPPGKLAWNFRIKDEEGAVYYLMTANGMLFGGTWEGKLYAFGKP